MSTPEVESQDAPEQLDFSDVEITNANLRPEDQEVDMEPVVLTPGAYASPDPETSGQVMLPLTEAAELGVEISADYAQDETATEEAPAGNGAAAPATDGVDYNSMTVADLKAELDDRQITYAGNASKADLVALLEEDDASKAS